MATNNLPIAHARAQDIRSLHSFIWKPDVLEELKSGIEIPDVAKIEAEKQQKIDSLAQQWKPFVTALPGKMDKVRLETKNDKGETVPLLEYDIDDKFREAVKSKMEEIVKSQANRGVEFNQETQEALVESWKQWYFLNNLPAIIENHIGTLVSKMSYEEFQKYHNPSQRPSGEAPGVGEIDESMEAIEHDIMGRK